MNCPNCGYEYGKGDDFCPMCGLKLDISSKSQSETPSKKPSVSSVKEAYDSEPSLNIENDTSSSRKSKKIPAIIGGLCAVGAAAGIIIPLVIVNAGKQPLTLEQQLESLQAKAETASAEDLPGIYAEAEKIQEQLKESVEASVQASIETSRVAEEAKTTESTSASTTAATTTAQTTQQTKPPIQTTAAAVSQDNNVTLNDAGSVVNASQYQAVSGSVVNSEPATILNRQGNMSVSGQVDSYTFTTPRDGRYRIEVSGMSGVTSADLAFYDSSGKLLESEKNCNDGEGITVKYLTGGETYIINVAQSDGLGSYFVNVGLQKPTIDVSYVSTVYDSMEYTDQRNLYNFTAPSDGTYTFEVSDMYGMTVDMYIFDDPGNKIDYKDNTGNGSNLTLKNIKAGEIYEIQVRQNSGYGSYTLNVR